MIGELEREHHNDILLEDQIAKLSQMEKAWYSKQDIARKFVNLVSSKTLNRKMALAELLHKKWPTVITSQDIGTLRCAKFLSDVVAPSPADDDLYKKYDGTCFLFYFYCTVIMSFPFYGVLH